jgi:small-conductance mechanosensitive channel
MDAIKDFILRDPMRLLVPLLVLVATLAIGKGVKSLLFKGLRRWSARTKSPAATILTQALDRPFMIWVLILGLHLASQSSALSEQATARIAKVLLALWIVSLIMMMSRLVGDLIKYYGSGVPGALPVTTLTQNLAQLGVVVLGLLVLLNSLGYSITPILTALGVGGLAVALALQDTLSNLFAGFYVAVAGQIRLGDYIKLNTGEEGYVADIAWRSTTIRALANNMIIIPNAKLAQAIVTNYNLPEKRLATNIQVGVSYASDPEKVEHVLLEEAREAAREIPGLLLEPAPQVRFDPGFGDSSLGFTLSCQVAEFVDQFLVRHELRKRILKRLRQEGIEMPFPTRTVYLRRGDGETG